jgi:hypothetical protein
MSFVWRICNLRYNILAPSYCLSTELTALWNGLTHSFYTLCGSIQVVCMFLYRGMTGHWCLTYGCFSSCIVIDGHSLTAYLVGQPRACILLLVGANLLRGLCLLRR